MVRFHKFLFYNFTGTRSERRAASSASSAKPAAHTAEAGGRGAALVVAGGSRRCGRTGLHRALLRGTGASRSTAAEGILQDLHYLVRIAMIQVIDEYLLIAIGR